MKKLFKLAIIFAPLVLGLLVWSQLRQQSNGPDPSLDAVPDVRTLIFAHDMPMDTAQHMAAVYFAERVARLSRNRLNVKIVPNQQLGTDQQMIAGAVQGDIDIILPPTSKLVPSVPEMGMLDLPYAFSSRSIAHQVLDGELGQYLIEKMGHKGLWCINYWESGFKQITSNFSIAQPDDFKNKSFRIMKSPILEQQYSLLGANPIPIDFNRVLQALEDGVIDGQENPIASIYSKQFYTAQKYLTLTNHGYLAQILCLSKKISQQLSDADISIVKQAADEAQTFQRNGAYRLEQEYINKIKNSGIAVSALTPQQTAVFKQRMQPLWHDYERDWPQTYALLTKTLADIESQLNEHYVVGLDADMSSGSAQSGMAIKRGVEIALEEINEQGGILGKKVRLEVRDHAGNAERGMQNIRYFSAQPNLLAVFGGLHSPVILAELPLLHELKIPMLVPWAAATPITDNGYDTNFVFRLSLRDADVGPFLIDKALNRSDNIALLLENTGWGRSNYKTMMTSLSRLNLKPVEVIYFNWGERYFDAILKKISNAGAEVIVFVGNSPEGSELIKALAEQTHKLPVVSHWGITGGEFWQQSQDHLRDLELVFVQSYSFFNKADANPIKGQFIDRYKRKYSVDSAEDIFAPTGTAHAYDLMRMLALAVADGNSDEREKIVDALQHITQFSGLVKHFSTPFTASDRDALNPSDYILTRFDEQGVIRPINKARN
jgi:C4-dicarboxylate-binding protein DctP